MPLFPHRLTWCPREQVDELRSMGYYCLDLENSKVISSVPIESKYVERIWKKIRNEDEFTDKIYLMREQSILHWKLILDLLKNYSNDISNDLIYDTMSPDQKQFVEQIMNKINPHIRSEIVEPIDISRLNW